MGYFSDIFKSDDAPVESDDLEQTAGFFSQERGQARSKALNDTIRYYLGPYLGAENGLLDSGNQLLNPIVGLQDSGVAFREGRYVDGVTDLAGASVPLAGAVVAKPLAKAVANKADDAVDMVSETLTGFSAKPKPFDPSRRKAMTQMGAAAVAAPVLASDATRGVLEEVIAPVVKKTVGSTPLTAAFEKLMTNKSSMENILEQENSIFRNMRQSDPYMNTPLTTDQNTLLNSLANTRNTINQDIITSIDEIVVNVDPSSVKGLSDTDLNSLLEEVSNRTWTIDPDIADVDVVIDTLMTEVQRRGLRIGMSQTGMPPANVAANMVPKDMGGETLPDLWSVPDQAISSADTSINSSKLPAGYKKLKEMGVFKEGQVVVDIGGGRFDNAVDDLATQGVDLKVYDPFNRSAEHNRGVASVVANGGADVAISNNVLNVIEEPENITQVIMQSQNAIKVGDKAYFTIYPRDKSGIGIQTSKGYQRNEPTSAYVSRVEEIFGEGNVERRGDVIIATKSADDVPTSLDAQTTQAFGTNGGPSMQSGPAEIGPQKRVDTRLPAEVVKDDTLKTGAMVSDGDSLMGNPNMYDNLVMMTDHYPGLKRLYSDDVAEIRGNITNRMTDNIVSLYDMSDKLGIAKDSANWYAGANRIANGLASRFGISDTKAAGVLAVMSPQKDWFQNVGLGERIIKHHTELGPNAPWTPEMEAITVTVPASRRGKGKANNTAWQDGKNGAILDAIKGKAWGQLETPMEKALWLRAYDEAHFGKNFREISPDGDILGYDIKKDGNPSAIAHQGFGDIAKAVRILEGEGTLTSISPELGGNHKVRNFFNNILNPDSTNDVTVDTHQIAAGLFRPLGSSAVEVHHGLNGANIKGNPARWSNEGKAETGMAGSYGLYFDATTDAASLRGTLPREMQSISWEQLRTLFPNNLKQDKDFVSQTEGIWRAVDSGTLSSMGAREAIIKLAQEKGAGGVPDWKNYKGPRRDIGTYATTAGRAAGAGTLLLGSAGLATAQEEGFAPEPEYQ